MKDILVYAGAGKSTPARLDVAANLAAAFQAHLTALHVLQPPHVPVETAGGVAARWVEAIERETREHAETARRLVAEAERRSGQSAAFRLVEGELVPTALLHSRYADLVVVGQAGAADPGEVEDELPETLIMGAGRPLLIVPSYGKFETIGERVLVAWKHTAESARAVHDALPILKKAKAVTVMTVNPPTGQPPHIAGADIASHLARHGVNVEVSSTVSADISVGDAILSRATDFGTDMIVMGAYGHSRLREFAFGGVTLHLLRHMTVPVFTAH